MPGAPPLMHLFGVPHLPPPGSTPAAFRPGHPGLLPNPSILVSPSGASAAFFPSALGSNSRASGGLAGAAQQDRVSTKASDKTEEASKAVTVYIGNINRHVDNDFMRLLLAECGRVIRWNRQADPTTGQLAAFGFCDFQDAVGALNALEVLPDLVIGGKALKVNCNEKVRAEVNRVREDRVLSTLHTFREKTREEVEKEIDEETARLRTAVLEVVKRKEAQIPPDDGEHEGKAKEKTRQEERQASNARGDKHQEDKEGSGKGASSSDGARADARAASRRSSSARESSSVTEAPAPLPANAPPGPPSKDEAQSAASVVAAAGGLGTFAGLSALKAMDPELAEAASSCSVYRVGPDGVDRRRYITEDYRPCRRELERLHHLERRDSEFEKEFRRRELEWITREEDFKQNKEKEIALEQEIRDNERQQLINEDLRGVWWAGLQDPKRRQERKRRRRRETEDDAEDREEEEKELREEERRRREERKRNCSRQEGEGDARPTSLHYGERETREKELRGRETDPRGAAASSPSLRHHDRKKKAYSPSSSGEKAPSCEGTGESKREGRKEEKGRHEKDSRRIKTEVSRQKAQVQLRILFLFPRLPQTGNAPFFPLFLCPESSQERGPFPL